jgi:hypothetical protein
MWAWIRRGSSPSAHTRQDSVGVGVGWRGVRDDVEQFEPVGVRHGADPLVVVLAAQHAVERVGQIRFVQCGRQHAVGDALLEFREEAVVRQDADVGIQARVAARLEQRGQVAAQGPGLAGMALQQLDQRAHLGARGIVVARAARTQVVDQVDQQVDAVAVRIEAFENREHGKHSRHGNVSVGVDTRLPLYGGEPSGRGPAAPRRLRYT